MSIVRVTQVVGEVLRAGAPKSRLTQSVVEVLRESVPSTRMTQIVVEVLRLSQYLHVNVQDYITVAEDTVVSNPLPTRSLSVLENVSTAESLGFTLVSNCVLFEDVAVVEDITLSDIVIECSVVDNVSISDGIAVVTAGLSLSVFDNVAVVEAVVANISFDIYISVVESVITSEDVEIIEGTLVPAIIFDTVTVVEDSTVLVSEIPLTVSLNDSIIVSEDVSVLGDSLVIPDLVDTVTVTENLVTEVNFPPIIADVYDAVTVTEAVTGGIESFFNTNVGIDNFAYWPVWELDAEFNYHFDTTTTLVCPVYSQEAGLFGSILEEESPTYSLTASIAQAEYFLSLDMTMPTWSGEGCFGWALSETIPVHEIEAAFSVVAYFNLAQTMPGWTVDGELSGELVFNLDRQIPVWTLDISWEDSGSSSFNIGSSHSIPVWTMATGILLLQGSFSLEGTIPVWESDADIYEDMFNLSATTPVWLMQMTGDGDTDSTISTLFEEDRFVDYVLQYVRP